MGEFQEAYSIELHDAAVVIDTDYFEGVHGFHEGRGPTFFVNGYELAMLAKVFGVEVRPTRQGGDLENIDAIELVGRKTVFYGEDFAEGGKVKAIYARVDGPSILSVKIVEEWDGQGEVTRTYTYCGSFTVEWKLE